MRTVNNNQRIFKHAIPLAFLVIILFPASLYSADKKPEKTFDDAAIKLITRVKGLLKNDRAKAFQEYAKGAQALAAKFPNEIGPLKMMAEASSLIKDKELSTKLAGKAETGVLVMLEKDGKNHEANAANQ